MRSSLEARIHHADVVSFDVFDTALLRALTRPSDLFVLMQADVARILGEDVYSFASVRVEAEGEARSRAWNSKRALEVTLQDIYHNLARLLEIDGATAEQICKLEIAAEMAICRQNPFIHSLYRRCIETKKRIAFISDTYLPEPLIAELLRRNGYPEYEALLVSSAIGKTKWSGALYDEGLVRVVCAPARWLHIGDNRDSDVRIPRRYGMATWQYKQCAELFTKNRVQAAAWQDRGPASPAEYVVQGLIINRLTQQRPLRRETASENFWENLGYRVAGPLLAGFVDWIIERTIAHDFQSLHFLARDGLIIKRVYEALRPPELQHVQTHYLYTSRRAMNFAAIKHLDESALEFLMQKSTVNAASLFLTRIGLDWRAHLDAFRAAGFRDPHQKIATEADFECLTRLLMLLAKPILDRAHAEGAIMRDYLVWCGLGSGRKAALVDVGWSCSQQKSVFDILRGAGYEPAITGLYIGTLTLRHKRYSHEAYLFRMGQPREYAQLLMSGIQVVESLFAATERGVLRIDRDAIGNFFPVRHDEEQLTERHKENTRRLHEGTMQFVEDYRTLKQGFPALSISPEIAVAELSRLLRHPTAVEAQNLGAIPFEIDFGDGSVRPIAPRFNPLMLLRAGDAIWQHYGYNVIPWKAGHDARASRLYRLLYRMMA